MIGSELLLLVLNVWFVRGYNSGLTILMMNGGTVAGRPAAGAILCLFCLLAYLKIAQKFDAYLATLGLNTAQTGGNLGMEMLVMTRMVGGMIGHGGFLHGSGRVGANAGNANVNTANGGAPVGFGARFRAAFNGETYRANNISAGPNQGFGGVNGWILNTIAGRQIRQGHGTDPVTVSRITNGTIAPRGGAFTGASADNSLAGFMPMFQGHKLSGTSIENGRISTTVTSPSGQRTGFEAFSAEAFDKPEGSFRTVTASDGSKWYVTANGEGAQGFFSSQQFTGSASESRDVTEMFPTEKNISALKTLDEGQMEASYADGTHGMMYSAALFEEPEGPYEVVTDKNGLDWYKMDPNANIPTFSDGMPDSGPPADKPDADIPVSDPDTGIPVPTQNIDVPDAGDNPPAGGVPSAPDGTPAIGIPAENTEAAGVAPEPGTVVPVTEDRPGVVIPAASAADSSAAEEIPAASGVPGDEVTVQPAAYAAMETNAAIPQYPSENGIESDASADIPVLSGVPEGTQITPAGDGVLEMRTPDGQTQTVYDSGKYEVSDTETGITGTVTDAAGKSWFIPAPDTSVSKISQTDTPPWASAVHESAHGGIPHTDHGSAPAEDLSAPSGSAVPPAAPSHAPHQDNGPADTPLDDHYGIGSSHGNFVSFMPGYGADVARVDTSLREEGQFTVYNKDGTGTRFYDMSLYRPVGDYRVFEDRDGHSWAAYDGRYQNVRQVVTDENGNPVVDKRGRAKEKYETVMSFRHAPQRIKSPAKRKPTETETPRRKKK